MNAVPPLRTLRIIALSFIPVMIGGYIAVTVLQQNWSEVDDAIGRSGSWVTGALGVIGMMAAIRWRARVTEQPAPPEALATSFLLTIAVAESSLLAGFVFTLVSHERRPFVVGLGLFAIALVVILATLWEIERATDDAAGALIR